MKKFVFIFALLALVGISQAAGTWNAYGVHGATITSSAPGTFTAVAGNDPDYHWDKSSWSTRTGQKAFLVTSDFNGMSVSSITSMSWNTDAGYWGNAYFNIMVEDAFGNKAIIAPSVNADGDPGWNVGSTSKDFSIFEAESGWTGPTGWYSATWDDIKDLTITEGPFTEFPDTTHGDALAQGDSNYSVNNWAAWADAAAGYDAGWETGGVLITFGQSTGPGVNPDTTTISNVYVNGELVCLAPAVPAPGALLLAGLGTACVGRIRRRTL